MIVNQTWATVLGHYAECMRTKDGPCIGYTQRSIIKWFKINYFSKILENCLFLSCHILA